MITLRFIVFMTVALASTARAQQTPTLTVGRAVERTLAKGEAHSYQLTLAASRFVAGRAVQHGVDVSVAVVGPSGDTITRVDSPNGKEGPEPFQFTSAAAGKYRVIVAALPEETGSGRYTLTVERDVAAATTPSGKVDQLLAAIGPNEPGVAVAVVRDGKIIYQNARGLANLTHKIPFTVNTLNNIGSTSKQFTAFSVLMLASQNRLSLDDDVRKHVPELPNLGQTVTIRHLLTHTSGYREFLNALALGGRRLDYGDYIDRAEIIDLVKRQPTLQNAPGAEFNYNNTGYGLLAVVVERVSGRTFPDFVQENIFRPLGMSSSVIRATPGQIIPNSSQGYTQVPGGFREAQDLGASMGAGGIYTTIADLAKWVANYKAQTVGPKGFFQQMTARNVLTKGDTSNYGLGLMIDQWRGLQRVRHGGADVAHRSSLTYFPDANTGITVQSNNASINTENYADRIAEFFLSDRLKAPPGAPVAAGPGARFDTTRFNAFAGRFSLNEAPNFIVAFTRRGDRYYTQATGQPEIEMQPTSDSTFKINGVDAVVVFHREPDGSVKRITLNLNGLHPGTRVGEAPAATANAKPDLNAYVGRYFSDELEVFFEVALEKDVLMLRGRRIVPVRLSPTTGDAFNGTFPVASLKFERDASGKVTGFRAGNGRTRDVLFKRVD